MSSKKRKQCDGRKVLKKCGTSMTEAQKNIMLGFISDHPQMIRNRTVGGASSDDRDALWDELAFVLNSCESGAQKDGISWRRSWNDMKRYESLKAAEAMAKSSHLTSDGSGGNHKLALSPLQEKIACLLSEVIADEPQNSHNNKRENDTINIVQELCVDTRNDTANIIAKALQDVSSALMKRNTIEEKKLQIFEEFLKIYANSNL